MASKTYSAEALVLRKTNLGESDTIVRMMDSQGRLLEGVAKGARRPQGTLSGRLELFNRVKVHCAKGRNLDVVKEARLVRAGARLHADPAATAAASCVAEFAGRTIQPDLEVPRYFELADAAFAAIDSADVPRLPAMVAAYVFKASAMIGMRPSFSTCVLCGRKAPASGKARVSISDGGFVCDECASFSETAPVDAALMAWAECALMSTFAELGVSQVPEPLAIDLLQLAVQWAHVQPDVRLKSASQLVAYMSVL